MNDRDGTTAGDDAPGFLADGGLIGAEMRGHDWAASTLGEPGRWPEVLRSAVATMLASPQPMFLVWGRWGTDLPFLFNDAYRPLLGQKADGAMGRPFADLWSDVWDDIAPIVRKALSGEGSRFENMPLTMLRNGYPEETWWSFCYMPLRDGNGDVAGMSCVTSDASGHVRSVAALTAERQRLTSLFEQAPGFMSMLRGPEHVIEMANPAYMRLVGFRDVLGKTVAQALPDAVEQGYLDLLDTVYRSGEAFAAHGSKYAMQAAPDGPISERFVDVVFQPIRGPAGEVDGIFIEGSDVTDRTLAEDALRDSEKRLRELNAELERQVIERTQARGKSWQLSPDLMGALNSEGYFETSNPAWRTTLGWTEEEVRSTSIFELLHPDDVERTRGGFELTQAGTSAIQFPNRYRCKDGNYRWISWVGVPEDGYIYCTGRDITEEKERALELAERTAQRDLLAQIVEKTDVLVMANDLDYDILAINKANADEFERVYGIRPKVGDNMLALIADKPEEQAKVRAAWGRALAGEEMTFVEAFGDPNRDRPYYEVKFRSLYNDRGERIGAYQFVTDVSDRLREQADLANAQEALRQSQKMEAVGQLTGGLAHDFNNLLAGISGSLEMIATRVSQGRASEMGRYIEGAQGAAKRAAALTHRLLAFSRRQTLAPKPTDVNRLVADMEDLVRRTVGPEIAMEIVPASGLWSTLVDPNQLENALLNLAINARDAMPDGGRLLVETANHRLDRRAAQSRDLPAGEFVSLCVSDNGTGMSADVIEKAFDPFFTTKPIGVGTGLGLSMIYGFARQSGGQVRIHSEVGRGTTVCIYLPRHAHEQPLRDDATASVEPPRGETGETVLVIEDEALVRMLVVDVLEDLGYTALEAGDGPSGMRIIQSSARIDLLITDVGLPNGMNGRQVADAARQVRPGLKVLFATGYAENAVLSHGHLDPGMHVVTKPFSMDALALRIKELISSA